MALGGRWAARGAVVAVLFACAQTAAAATWTSGAARGLPNTSVFTDPGAPDRIYAGPVFRPSRLEEESGTESLYVSEDRGVHWSKRQLPEPSTALVAFAGPPSLLIEVASSGRLHRSTDQGRTWSPGVCCVTTIDAGDPQRLVGFDDRGLVRSVDGGATWQPLGPLPLPADFGTRFVFGNGTLWATTDSGGVARSTDAGLTWSVATGVPDGALVPVPGAPGRLYAGAWRSSDDGANWLPSPVPDICFAAVTPADHAPAAAWTASCDGPYRTLDGGATWAPVEPAPLLAFASAGIAPLDGGLRAIVLGRDGPWLIEPGVPPVYRGEGLEPLAFDAVGADPTIAGRARAGTFMTSDGGTTWQPSAEGGFPGVRVGARQLVESADDDVLRSRPALGGAATAVIRGPAVAFGEPRGRRAWIVTGDAEAGTDRLLRTEDGVHLHRLLAAGLPAVGAVDDDDERTDSASLSLAAAGGRSRTLAMVITLPFGTDRLAISHDRGRTFTLRPMPRVFLRLQVDAIDGRLLLATDPGNTLYRSTDAGRSFVPSLRAVRAIAVDPSRRGVWYAARSRRLYVTRDAGRTWRRIAAPPGGVIRALSAGAGRLWAATDTRISSLPIGQAGR